MARDGHLQKLDVVLDSYLFYLHLGIFSSFLTGRVKKKIFFQKCQAITSNISVHCHVCYIECVVLSTRCAVEVNGVITV